MNKYLTPHRPYMPGDTAAPSRVLYILVEMEFWGDLNDLNQRSVRILRCLGFMKFWSHLT